MVRYQPVGWQNWKAYPLLVSTEVERALTLYMAATNQSRGKALNRLLADRLVDLGYLARSLVCLHPEKVLRQTPTGYGPYWFCKTCEVRLE